MATIQTTIHPHIQRQFQKGFRWTLAGSLTYETLKIIHCALLLKILPETLYGAMGSMFSLIYLVTYMADLGATNSIPPFVQYITQSRRFFLNFLVTYSLAPHLPVIVTCAAGATFFVATRFTLHPALFTTPLLIVLETVRLYLRMMLHVTFQAKRAMVADLSIFVLYLAGIWIPRLYMGHELTLNHIFIPHLIDSALSVAAFMILLRKFYATLPVTSTHTSPPLTANRIITTRLFNYLLRVSRNMFTSNFLTPLFAIKFGLASAGLFYFSATMINALQSIIKSAIGYSGGALLANLKSAPQSIKKEAFAIISQKLITIVAPVILMLSINHRSIIKLSQTHNATDYIVSMCMLFLILSLSEFFFILYEQFYIIEEAAHKLFLFKIFELTIFYGLITSSSFISPISVLMMLISIRMMSIAVVALNAFYWWKISPNLTANRWYIAAWIAIASFIACIVR